MFRVLLDDEQQASCTTFDEAVMRTADTTGLPSEFIHEEWNAGNKVIDADGREWVCIEV